MYTNIDAAKQAARRLRSSMRNGPVTCALSTAQAIVAAFAGYNDWHHLEQTIGTSHAPGLNTRNHHRAANVISSRIPDADLDKILETITPYAAIAVAKSASFDDVRSTIEAFLADPDLLYGTLLNNPVDDDDAWPDSRLWDVRHPFGFLRMRMKPSMTYLMFENGHGGRFLTAPAIFAAHWREGLRKERADQLTRYETVRRLSELHKRARPDASVDPKIIAHIRDAATKFVIEHDFVSCTVTLPTGYDTICVEGKITASLAMDIEELDTVVTTSKLLAKELASIPHQDCLLASDRRGITLSAPRIRVTHPDKADPESLDCEFLH